MAELFGSQPTAAKDVELGVKKGAGYGKYFAEINALKGKISKIE